MKIIKNIVWLVGDRFLILFLQFFVGVKIANYYGPTIYGKYSYALTLIAFSPLLLELINGRVIKEYYDDNFNKTVSTVTTIKIIMSIFILFITVLSWIFLKNSLTLYIILVLLAINNILLNMTYGIENYFEYRLLSKNIVLVNSIVKIIAYSFIYIGILFKLSIIIIPIVQILSNIIRIILLKRSYHHKFKTHIIYILDNKFIKIITKNSIYLWLGMVSFIIYCQIDKIMIKQLLGLKEVGIYTIASSLSGIFAILIPPFQNSVYTKLIELYKSNYEKYIEIYLNINTIFTQLYLVLAILSIIVVKYAFPYVYNKEYEGAVSCYMILVISIFFKANGCLQTGHMTLKKITKKSFYKTLIGLILNIILNLILIPKYGINGAALATSITTVFTLFILDAFIKDYREQFFIQLKSFNTFKLINIILKRREYYEKND